MSFFSEVRSNYHAMISSLICSALSIPKSCVSASITPPQSANYIQVEGFWLQKGTMPPVISNEFVLTDSIRKNLKNLARIVSARYCIICLCKHYYNFFFRKLPILLQGPTSAGKTSMVQFLAKLLGRKCVRINNHEHTDLQEYVGMYTANSQGQLIFQEGVFVCLFIICKL